MTLRLRFRGDPVTAVRKTARWALLLTGFVSAASSDSAQSATQPRGALGLRVVDADDRGVKDAEVYVVGVEARLRTQDDGRALLVGVREGHYEVAVRRVGFLPRRVTVPVTRDSTIYTVVVLVPTTTRLAPVVTAATRTGLFGTVSDTSLRALRGARVSVAGSGRSIRTDSAGRFFMSLRGGSYMLRVERDSFAIQTFAVTVPKDSGREVAVWLVPQSQRNRAVYAVEATRQFDLDQRMIRANPAASRFYTRDQLIALGINDMARLARQWATGGITALCLIQIMGTAHVGGYSVPLTSVITDEVEFVEVYFGGGSGGGGGSRRSRPGALSAKWNSVPMSPTPSGGTSCGYVAINVWPRQ